jgi:hypothetical protein
MGLPYRARVNERWFLNLPGFHSGASAEPEHRASIPGAEVRILSRALVNTVTPWPSGEARALQSARPRFDSVRCLGEPQWKE